MIQFKIKPQRKCRDLIYVLSPRSFVRAKKALERKNTPGGLFPPFNLGEIILQGIFPLLRLFHTPNFKTISGYSTRTFYTRASSLSSFTVISTPIPTIADETTHYFQTSIY